MTTCTTNIQKNAPRNVARPSIPQWLIAAFSVRKQRKSLSNLDPHLLNDIGLTRETAEREVKRKLWDVPQHWLQ